MNGPFNAMYKVKPFYDLTSEIELPDCMYKMPNVHKVTQNSAQGSSGAFEVLELRQEHILKRLEELKVDLQKLSNQLVGSGLDTPNSSSHRVEIIRQPLQIYSSQNGIVQDIVISANPNQPPLSLLVLYHMLKEQIKVMTSSHIHSSIKELPSHLHGFLSCQINGLRTDHQLALTLIWKEIQNGPNLMVSPRVQAAIQGEANIARFLARLLDPSYDLNDAVESTLIDSWLDLASNSCINGNTKEKASVVRTLNSHLGKFEWLLHKGLSLADIVMWSAMCQTQQVDTAPANVKKWYQACCNHPAFSHAVNYCKL